MMAVKFFAMVFGVANAVFGARRRVVVVIVFYVDSEKKFKIVSICSAHAVYGLGQWNQ